MRAGEPVLTAPTVSFRCAALAALITLASAGCGDSSADANDNSSCPAGFELVGESCAPIFDDCTGPAEIAALGGGCQRVGVTACATGLFESDGAGGCEPILPPGPEDCPAGSIEVLGQTECQPVGVTECAPGFATDGEGGCLPILPPGPEPCPSGTIALLGSTACQPLGDCGTTTWGHIVDDPETVYVDQSADATGANGSPQAPFVTIGAALAMALPEGQIAIAAGDYEERLNVNQRVRLTGRCAALVTVRGRFWLGSPHAPLRIDSGGSGSTVTGITFTGPAEGLVIAGAQQVVLNQLQVQDASSTGIDVHGGSEVQMQQVVIARNTTVGVLSAGASVDLSECVIRDTRVAQNNGEIGVGIYATCVWGATCDRLRLDASLVSRNRWMGVLALGADVEVTGTVVRDTLPELSTGNFGYGIAAQCSADSSDCGSLLVSGSFVSGNRAAGVAIIGPDVEVTETVVRDTLPGQSDGTLGVGIVAECYEDHEACGQLIVSSSFLTNNRYLGIFLKGIDAEIRSTVVRDTQPEESTGILGPGIEAKCDVGARSCGTLLIASSLVSGNRGAGIVASGVDTDIINTVVRDNLPEEASQMFGRGIEGHCDLEAGSCSGLRITSCLVYRNRDVGILIAGSRAEITSSVIRDTLPEEASQMFGRGIGSQCVTPGACGSLRVTSSLVSDNRDVGINAIGVDAEIVGTVVRDTLPRASDGLHGRGINAQCSILGEQCGSLYVNSTLVHGSENVGIYIGGPSAVLEGVAVLDTRPNTDGSEIGAYGQGIWALCDEATGDCGALSMRSCLVDFSQGAGVAVEGISGSIVSSEVRAVVPQALDGKYGYGIQIGGRADQQGQDMPTFEITECVVRDARLAGILYFRARGSLSGTWVSGGENSVVMNEGAELEVLDNNSLSGSVESDPTWANLYPSPAPPPALPQ